MRILIFTLLFSYSNFLSINTQAGPVTSGLLSIVPGLGQTLDNRPLEGLAWFSSVVGLYLFKNSTVQQIGFDLWQYNMYDAFRDDGGSPSTKYNVFQNYIAAYNPANIIDPIGASIIGVGALSGKKTGYAGLKSPSKIVMYGFVGLGEEALFRGFAYPALSKGLGSKTLGAVTSSLLFAAFHVTNGKGDLGASKMIQRSLAGLLFCWQADLNKYDLRKGIFAHTWYDILVDGNGKIDGVSLSLPF